MAVIYTDAWYAELKDLINGSEAFAAKAPRRAVVMAVEVLGDAVSPYVPGTGAVYYRVALDGGRVAEIEPTPARPEGGLDFRFTAPAALWEGIAAGQIDPITAGLRGQIRIRGDMRFLMENADAVKLLVDLYAAHGTTEWPRGRPPYA